MGIKLRVLFLLSGITFFIASCGSTDYTNSQIISGQTLVSEQTESGTERSIVHIAGDVYRFRDNHHTGLIVPTEEGVVLIDPLNVNAAQWVKGAIESNFNKPVTHILYSHGHQDHASGAAIFDGAEIISHKNTLDVITPSTNESLPARYAALDGNGDGELTPSELTDNFSSLDANVDGVVSGSEGFAYFYKDVLPPTQPYDAAMHKVEVGGKTIEMHYVGGNHASDMSYIFFPEESIVFYVDIISLKAIPFGALPWYSLEDSQNTYDKALAIDADIAVPSHGPIGTQDDVRDLRQYMADLRSAVSEKMQQGMTLEQIQGTLKMDDYANWSSYERLPQNIEGMHRALMTENKNR